MDFSPLIPSVEKPSIFLSITVVREKPCVAKKRAKYLNFYVSEIAKSLVDEQVSSNFAFHYFELDRTNFLKNQDSVQFIAMQLFGHNKSMTEFEQAVLNISFRKALKKQPSRPNRR